MTTMALMATQTQTPGAATAEEYQRSFAVQVFGADGLLRAGWWAGSNVPAVISKIVLRSRATPAILAARKIPTAAKLVRGCAGDFS
jgi:hypothetical protein